MDDLMAWLREQTADLRKAALAALRGYPYPTPGPAKHDTDHWHSHWDALYQAPGRGNYVGGCEIANFPQAPYAAAFAARFDPAAALAQCESHTAILDAVQRYLDGHPGPCTNDDNPWDRECELHLEWNKTTLPPYAARLVALAYQHNDGFREEWR